MSTVRQPDSTLVTNSRSLAARTVAVGGMIGAHLVQIEPQVGSAVAILAGRHVQLGRGPLVRVR